MTLEDEVIFWRFCVYIRRKLRKIVRISKEKCNLKVYFIRLFLVE